jgi:hypothetical protein
LFNVICTATSALFAARRSTASLLLPPDAAAKTGMNWRRQLTNTWQTDGLFLRFSSRLFATEKNGKF